MPNFHVTVRGTDRNSMADLVRMHGLRVYGQTLEEGPASCRVDAVADDNMINQLIDAGYTVERHEDVDEAARDSLSEVGQGNRYRNVAGS